MGQMLGASGGQTGGQHFPNWARAFADYVFAGKPPGPNDVPTTGLFGQATQGYAPMDQWLQGLVGQFPNAQQAGADVRGLASNLTGQGVQNTSQLANMAMGPVGQSQGLAGMIPQAFDVANYYATQGLNPAITGSNVMGAQGAGQDVVNAALAAAGSNFDNGLYNRVVAQGLPEVRSSYSARGLGSSGEAAQGEQDYIQKVRDQIAQQEIQNKIGALGAAASAAGPAASQAIGAQQTALGRGQLGLSAAQLPAQVLAGFQNVAQNPLNAMGLAAGLQQQPLDLATLGTQLYGQGLNLPLNYQQAVYQFAQDPVKTMLSAFGGTKLTEGTPYRGIFGTTGK